MIEDKIIVTIYINKYFSYLNENERNEMVKKIFSFVMFPTFRKFAC